MSSGKILIVTQEFDLHADELVVKLSERGHEPIRLNSNDFPQRTDLSLSNSGGTFDGIIKIKSNGRLIDLSEIRSIWWRQPSDFVLPEDLSEQERKFAHKELQHFWNGLWSSISCYWISQPVAIRQASWKMEQLQRAASFGFEVPRTIFTTDPQDVPQFYEECNRKIIYKVLTDPLLSSAGIVPVEETLKVTYTTLIGEDELQALDVIAPIPCLFQEYIEKEFELRVTVIGDEIFPARIDSQANPGTAVDWRVHGPKCPFAKDNLPLDVGEKCLQFVKSYGLNFSAIDLIVTPNGRYVFLENNPNGQFIFIEKLVPELKMIDALADCLVRGSN